MGSGVIAVTVEALSARDSSVSMIGVRIVSPQNFSVLYEGIEVLAGGSSEGGGRSKGSFLNTDIDLTGKLNMAHVEIRGGSRFRRYIFPGYSDAFKLHPVGAHVIGEVEER